MIDKSILENNLNDSVSYEDFFHAFGYNNDDSIYLRYFYDKEKDEPDYSQEQKEKDSGNIPAKLRYLSLEHARMEYLNGRNCGIFFCPNGGNSDKEILTAHRPARAQFAEMDHGSMEEQLEKISRFHLEPSIMIRTQKSLHVYWLLDPMGKIERFRNIQLQLVAHFDGDPAVQNESRFMRLYGFNHCKRKPVLVRLLKFNPELKYTQDELSSLLPEAKATASGTGYRNPHSMEDLGKVYTGFSYPESFCTDLRLSQRDKSLQWFGDFCDRHNINIIASAEVAGVMNYAVDCPCKDKHTNSNKPNDSVITIGIDGKIGYHCFHTSCGIGSWKDFRNYYEPEDTRPDEYLKRQKEAREYPTPSGSALDWAGEIGGSSDTAAQGSATTEAQAPGDELRAAVNMSPDEQLLFWAGSTKNGERFRKLWSGDREGYYSDDLAELALLDALAFWTQKDAGRMETLFTQSALYDPELWKLKGNELIKQAIEECKAVFDGNGSKQEYIARLTVPMRRDPHRDTVGVYLDYGMEKDLERFQAEIPTGYTNFDVQLGGLYTGLYVLAAISSLGKSTYAGQMAEQIAATGRDVLFFALEMSKFEMVSKGIARTIARKDPFTHITSVQIRKGVLTKEVMDAADEYKEKVGGRLSFLAGNMSARLSDICRYVRDYVEATKTKPVVFIDYLQIIQPDDDKLKGNAKAIADTAMTTLKKLSGELGICVFLICSVNRNNYLMPVDFESLKESGNIEYSADAVFGLQLQALDEELFSKEGKVKEKRDRIKEAKAENPRKIRLTCLKNRYGYMDIDCSYDYYPAQDLFCETSGTKEDAPRAWKGVTV